MRNAEEKGRALFKAAYSIEETWKEIDRMMELFDRRATKLSGTKARLEKDGGRGSDIPDTSVWVWSYDYKFFYTRKKKYADMYLSVEFRLCWDKANQIEKIDGTDFGQPIIIVKANSEDKWEVFEPNISIAEDEEYTAFNKLLWYSKDSIYWLFAVPLFQIGSEEDLVQELFEPVKKLLFMEPRVGSEPELGRCQVFANTRHVLSWKTMKDGTCKIDEAAVSTRRATSSRVGRSARD